MRFDRRDHGGTGHSQTNDADSNRPVRRFLHISPLAVDSVMAILPGRMVMLRVTDHALRCAEFAVTLSHQGQTPGIT